MIFLSRLYPGDAFAAVAINVIIQVGIIAILAVIASRTFARRNAALRHCILLSALLWTVVCPLAAARLSRAGILTVHLASMHTPTAPASPAGIGRGHLSVAMRPVVHETSAPSSAGDTRRDPIQVKANAVGGTPPSVNPVESMIGGAILLWLVVTATLLVRLAWGILKVSRIRCNARPADTDVQAVIRRSTAGLDHLPPILISDAFGGPVTVGIWRSAIILPAGLLAESDADEIRDVLVHERVHAIRGDYAIGILQRFVAATLWFHPMVHLLNRELRTAREEVCDNAVLLGRSQANYARTLLGLCQRIHPVPSAGLLPGLFDHTSPLEHRIAGILNPRRVVMTRTNHLTRIFVVVTAAGLGLVLSGTGLSRGQTPTKEPAQASSASSAPTTSSADGLAALEHNPDLVSEEEKALRGRLEVADRALRRAVLNVKEAEIKLKVAQTDLNRKNQLLSQRAVPTGDVEQAKLDVELAEVQVERARIGLDEAEAATVPVREIRIIARDGQREFGDRYSVRFGPPTVKEFLEQHFQDALSDRWDVSLIRESQMGPRSIFRGVLSLGASPFSFERLQAGDQIYIRRNIVRVLSGPGSDSQVIWEGPPSGKLTTVPQILELAKVKFDDHDRRLILLTGYRIFTVDERRSDMATPGPEIRWIASLSSIAGGFGKSERVEPSDTIVLNWQ